MEVQHDAKEPIPHAAKRLATGMMPTGPLVAGGGLERIRIQSGGEDVTGKPRARLMGLLFAALMAVSPAPAETQFDLDHVVPAIATGVSVVSVVSLLQATDEGMAGRRSQDEAQHPTGFR